MGWFEDLTGLGSDAPDVVQAGIAVQGEWLRLQALGKSLRFGRLELPSLAELEWPGVPARRVIGLREVVGDVRALHGDPANADAVFQVASQFNLLEMIGPSIGPEAGIAGYAHDQTQGPACAMACAAGTIYRNYLVPVAGQIGQSGRVQLDMLADFGALVGNRGGALWRMQNGYVLPEAGGLARIAAAIAAQSGLQATVRVGVQADTAVTLPGAAHCVTQVYCSALPIAYCRFDVQEWEPFARLILNAAYLATFAVAWRNAQRTGQKRLYLTRLGGGAFGNPPEWINDAIKGALTRFAGCDLDVVLVSHAAPSPENRRLIAAVQ